LNNEQHAEVTTYPVSGSLQDDQVVVLGGERGEGVCAGAQRRLGVRGALAQAVELVAVALRLRREALGALGRRGVRHRQVGVGLVQRGQLVGGAREGGLQALDLRGQARHRGVLGGVVRLEGGDSVGAALRLGRQRADLCLHELCLGRQPAQVRLHVGGALALRRGVCAARRVLVLQLLHGGLQRALDALQLRHSLAIRRGGLLVARARALQLLQPLAQARDLVRLPLAARRQRLGAGGGRLVLVRRLGHRRQQALHLGVGLVRVVLGRRHGPLRGAAGRCHVVQLRAQVGRLGHGAVLARLRFEQRRLQLREAGLHRQLGLALARQRAVERVDAVHELADVLLVAGLAGLQLGRRLDTRLRLHGGLGLLRAERRDRVAVRLVLTLQSRDPDRRGMVQVQ